MKTVLLLLLPITFMGSAFNLNKNIPKNNPSMVCAIDEFKENDALRIHFLKKFKSISDEMNQQIKTDTLQYIGEGENEDNNYSIFLNKKLETLNIVMMEGQHLNNSSINKMFTATWKVEMITAGGDNEVRYEQPFMIKLTAIEATPFK